MKLTLSNVKELKHTSNNPLTKRVCNYVISRWGDYNDKKRNYIEVNTMNANYIRPIPKRIEKRILNNDAKHGCNSGLRFYAYLTTIQKELVTEQ